MAILETLKVLLRKKIIILLAIVAILLLAVVISTPKKANLAPIASLSPTLRPSIVPDKTGKGDPAYTEEIETGLSKRYPLFPYLPYSSSNFSINYTGPLQLEVKLKTASASAKQNALDWIKGKGVDPQSHKIIFK